MQNAAGDRIELEPDDRNDTYLAVVSDLVALIEHVRASLRLIEQAIAQEASLGNQEVCANVIVLDDVTPRYMRQRLTLRQLAACSGSDVTTRRSSDSLLRWNPANAQASRSSDDWLRLTDLSTVHPDPL